MDELAKRLCQFVGSSSRRLTIVRDMHGFLSLPDTQQAVREESCISLVPIKSSLELRLRYETEDKRSEERICYVVPESFNLMPDLKNDIDDRGSFDFSRIFNVYDSEKMNDYTFSSYSDALCYYNRAKSIVHNRQQGVKEFEKKKDLKTLDLNHLNRELRRIKLDWDNPGTIDKVFRIVQQAICCIENKELFSTIENINSNFQSFLMKSYFSLHTSSYLSRPKIVSRVLPYLAHVHKKQDNVALIVIDGMAYWQYLILEEGLKGMGFSPQNSSTMAWLPSITQLSRQALFKGDVPEQNYVQNPQNESQLWQSFWEKNGIPGSEINYEHGNIKKEYKLIKRLAIVDVELDELMHSSKDYDYLYSSTNLWAGRTAMKIRNIHSMGYTIYITTDHGNVYSQPWRSLSPQEKTFLYKNNSRGTRHLIYDNADYKKMFLEANQDVRDKWLEHENWIVWRNDRCFSNKSMITHGGSHFFELAIPFITINHK